MIKKILLALALTVAAGAAQAVTYTYVGSWNVSDGPNWAAQDAFNNYTTGIYTGQEAAALLFGGVASDYAISTVSDQVADINFSAWLDGWGDASTYGPIGGTPAPQDFSVDTNSDGLYAIPFSTGSAYSAYVSDHVSSMLGAVNYAFQVSGTTTVPVPAALPLLMGGVATLGALRRTKRKS